jgi:glycosyltransferase involved in cell wall biosynthesis
MRCNRISIRSHKMTMKSVSTRETSKREIAYLSTYPPRECGIATFTKDLIGAVDRLDEFELAIVVAVNENDTIYNYAKRVRCQIERDSVEDYIRAADYINSSKVDLVNLQHEFGLFGGEWGNHIDSFLEHVRKPIVTTLHTIEPNFGSKAQTVLNTIASRSAAIVVMAQTARQILAGYGVPNKKITVIQHGCPDVPLVVSEDVKALLGLKNRIILSTFGLISRGKGIEYAIRALPSVVAKEPRVIYLIIGETHPEVRKAEGERYRIKLMRLVNDLGLRGHVKFHNRFLPKRELIRYLQATDIYVTPYISPYQASSGTLVAALGAGKAIVSTPYLHAKETLGNGRGLFCRFKDSSSIAECIISLLDERLRRKVEKRAYKYSRGFVWLKVAARYAGLFSRTITKNKV